MRSICAITLVALSCFCARADVTLSVFARDLRTFGGTDLMPVTGLVLLVASADGTAVFDGPTATSFVSGVDDVVVLFGNLSGTGLAGRFSGVLANLVFTGGLNPGDPLQLYWFPDLTLADYDSGNGSPGVGTTFGSYRTDGPEQLNGGAPWVIPPEPSAVDLIFRTDNVSDPTGQNTEAQGWANQIIPVPEASSFITAGLALGLCAFRLALGVRQKLMKR